MIMNEKVLKINFIKAAKSCERLIGNDVQRNQSKTNRLDRSQRAKEERRITKGKEVENQKIGSESYMMSYLLD